MDDMKCTVCETKVTKGDSFYWEFDHNEGSKPIHSDCLIRKAEFLGDQKGAEAINNFDKFESQKKN